MQAGHDVPEPINAGLDGIHRDASEREDALEHHRHDGHKDQRAPDLVRQDAIQLVAESIARRRQFGGDGALDGGDAHVTAFNGGAPPVNAGGIEPAAGGGHRLLDRGRVMLEAGSQRLLVAENEQCFRRRLGPPLVECFSQQPGKLTRFGLERGRQFGELARPGRLRGLQRGDYRLPQFRDSLACAGDHRQHRHAEFGSQFLRGNLKPVRLRHINHVQRDERGVSQFDHLRGVVEVALQVGRIHHHCDDRGRGQFGQAVEQHIP